MLDNEELSKMVDTNDEWIMTRIGVKERRILHEEGLGTAYMARKATRELMRKTKSNPDDIDLVIVATTTPDYHFPSTASILCDKLGLKNAFAYDLQAACSGFLYAMETAANFIRSGRYKKIIIVGADKMSSMVDYSDRATCPIFGDGAAAFMLEPTTEEYGILDARLRTDGKGLPFLHMKAGGSVCPPSYFTVDNKMHYIYQEGRTVFRYAVSNMSNISAEIAERNGLDSSNINYVVPHQANLRIIDAVRRRLELSEDKMLVNIEKYGNTSGASLPLCIWDFEKQLKKGDNIIFTAFGAGFTWGAVYVKWGYDSVE
ncbi:MAG: beta-ketoacyl-ACP synthase III [Bacteroides sp.]